MVVTDGIRPTLAGVLLGLAIGRLMTTLVFGVTRYDAATLSAVATILTLVGAVASLVPAYRATKIDPLMALRDDR